jgi:hypothetical protein
MPVSRGGQLEHSSTTGPDGLIVWDEHYLVSRVAHFNRKQCPSGCCTPKAAVPVAPR